MKYLPWLFTIALLLSYQTVRAEAIFVDTSGSMGDGLQNSSTVPYPLRRIDLASKFLTYTFSNWGAEKTPVVLTWSTEPTVVPGGPKELASYFERFQAVPTGRTMLGKVMMDEYPWASCVPLLVVTDKRSSDPELFESILRKYLSRTSVTIVIVGGVDAARAYDYFRKQSALPHYRVVTIENNSNEDVLLELLRQQREDDNKPTSGCDLNV